MSERRVDLALWTVTLVGPVAWTVHLLTAYALEEVIACAPGSGPGAGVLGVDVRTVIILVTAATATAALAGVVGSMLLHRRHRVAGASQRRAWMSVAGVMNGVFFLLVIAIGFLPPVLLETCRTAV